MGHQNQLEQMALVCDVAADRAHEALKHAALACAEAALGDPDIDRDNQSHVSNVVAPNVALPQAMLAHEVAAIVNLHHHAAGVQNIRNFVHVILDLTVDNYKRWRDQLLLVVSKYSMEDHVLQDTLVPGFPD
jgi:non-ribosomal peptide synthetase component F